ncbi:MAG: Kazal-type serine protease inhibitor family protein [Candidatus Paceibacteria bacterium]
MKHKITWHNKYFVLIGVLSLSLFLVGCFHSKDKKQEKEKKEKKQQAVIKKPPEKDKMNLEEMYSKCMDQGFQVVSRFDRKLNKNIRYCRFNDGTECRLKKFAQGKCGPNKSSKKVSFQSTVTPRSKKCQEYKPVCGVDGRTYANKCLTEKLNIDIKHSGPCKKEDRENIKKDKEISFIEPRQNKKEQKDTIVKQKEKKQQVPKWINMVVALVKNSPKTNPPMEIKRCITNNSIRYLQTNNTNNVVSTLYNKQGEVICHPSKDFSNLCPNNLSSIKNNCQVIWKDKR